MTYPAQKKAKKSEEELATELALFQSAREQELRAKSKIKYSNLKLYYDLIHIWCDTIVVCCDSCRRTCSRTCKHWNAEEFAVFWNLRRVCKQWRDAINDYFKRAQISLLRPYEKQLYFDQHKLATRLVSLISGPPTEHAYQEGGAIMTGQKQVYFLEPYVSAVFDEYACLCESFDFFMFLKTHAEKYSIGMSFKLSEASRYVKTKEQVIQEAKDREKDDMYNERIQMKKKN